MMHLFQQKLKKQNYQSPCIALHHGLKAVGILIFFFLIQSIHSTAQTATVALHGDGTNSSTVAPQGALRYQRGFYLIRQQELAGSGLVNGDTVNCIGFTIGSVQSDTTKGAFKVYLQNTLDSVSRVDTGWTSVTGLTTNAYLLPGLFSGKYQWQVKTNCSVFGPTQNFANNNLDPCLPPTHIQTDSITSSSARLTWIAPVSPLVEFYVEYKKDDILTWTGVTTPNSFLKITGLVPNSGYQWRVRTRCAVDSSFFSYESFNTLTPNNCTPPTALTVVSTNDTSAILNWDPTADADYYSVRFRRAGSKNWNQTLSFLDSIQINNGLVPGTLYEWEVSTNCGLDSIGAFVSGPKFMTTGTLACYFPASFYVDSLTSNSVKLAWDSVPGATSYELRYRAKDIISWASAITPMLLVHDDSIAIPDVLGPYNTLFKGSNIDTFKYTGGGVYVAWEYVDTLDILTNPNKSLSNAAKNVIKGTNGQDSITYLLSFVSRSDSSLTSLDSILSATNVRPETRLCSPSFNDSVAVLAVYALGQYAPVYTAAPVSAVIRNFSNFARLYTVNMQVKDQATNVIRYTTMQNIMVGPDTIGLIVFNGWVPSVLETDSIIISILPIPGEKVVNNNQKFYLQKVNQNLVSFDDGADPISQAGTDTMAGYTLSRHLMQGCGKINSVQVYISESAIGHEIYGIVLDTNKVVVARSASFIPDSSQINQYYYFFLSDTARLLQNEEYYLGLGQVASANAYFPVGVQYEGDVIRDSAYYRYHILNDSLFHQTSPGRLMIRAELIPGFAAAAITGDLFLCAGTMDTLVASTILAKYAQGVIAYSSQFSNNQYTATEVLGTPNVYPRYGIEDKAWFSAGDGGKEYLVLQFANPDSINFIDIVETYNPGSLDSIYLIDSIGGYHLIFSDLAGPAPQIARRNRLTFPLTPYKVAGVRLAFDMDAVAGYSAVDAVCIGRLTTPGIFSSITWSGGGVVQGAIGDTLIVSMPGGYKLTTVGVNGCTSTDSVTVLSPSLLSAVIVASDSSLCPGDSLKLKSSLSGGNIWSTGAMTDSIYVSTPGYYWVMYDDGTGCGITIDSILVTIDTLPVVMITGDTVICPGGYTVLSAGTHPAYLWSSGVTSDTIKVFTAGTLQVKVTDGHGCSGYDTITTTINAIPAFTISGIPIFCPGDSTLLYVGPGYNTYLWSTGATTDSIYVKAAGPYSVTVTDSHGCMASEAVEVSVSSLVVPIISAVDTNFCPGDSVMLISNQIGNNLWSNGATTDFIYVTSGGAYFATYDDGSGCNSNMSNIITVTVDTVPVVNITGDTLICSGGSVLLDAGIHPDYLWSTGAVSSGISVDMASTYSVIVTDGNGCTGTDSITTVVSVSPVATITGNLVFCPGDSTTLHASLGSGYMWSTGATADSIVVKTADVFSVTITNADGCSGSSFVQTSLFNFPNPMIASNNGYCPGSSVVLDAGAGYSSYTWSTSAATRTISVSAAANYSVIVSDANGCKATANKNIVAYAAPVAFIGGTLSFCDGGSTTTLEGGLGYQNYLWSTGETTHSISVTDTGVYTLKITDMNGCTDSTSAHITLEGSLPDIPGPIMGSEFGMCNTVTPSTYSVSPVPNSTCYIWRVPKGATIISGFMADSSVFFDSIQVIFDNTFMGGFIEVSAHNDCGASPTWKGSSLYISAAPGSVPGSIAGLTSGICKQGSATYTLPPINNATGYLWTVPLGATIVSGQNTNSIHVEFASSYRTGDICVQYTTQCGTSPFECVSVSPTPVITTNIQGSGVTCEFAVNEMYSIAPTNGANDYTWTVPTGATIMSGQGTPSIKVNFGSHSGIITVRAGNACGLSPIQYIPVTLGKCSVIGGSDKIARQIKDGDQIIKVFPNPSEGIVQLTFSSVLTGDEVIQIVDPLGRVVFQTGLNNSVDQVSRLDLHHLDKGMYFLIVHNGIARYSSKIILR